MAELVHKEATAQLFGSLDRAMQRAQTSLMPAKADYVAITVNVRSLLVNLMSEVVHLRKELDAIRADGPSGRGNGAAGPEL